MNEAYRRHTHACWRLQHAIWALRGARRYDFDPALIAECAALVGYWREERRAAWRALVAAQVAA